ncbi:MAG: tRNA uridine-5-carboxymethylaminomethyl(34) synthesis GTPase MnmE, partial [Sphingomonadaceae bacterium]|nr:tRNA uridine-5-carboxymethylaminomethyl(34) synthesis GTPase MnmE [Sphingomonadaceae bacterium]
MTAPPRAGDTIFALSTAGLPSAIAIVRASGPAAGSALEALTGRAQTPRVARLARLRDPDNGELIDRALTLWFSAETSETGEDVAEFHIHGSRAIAATLLAALGAMPGLRAAEPGEFMRRRLLNGKIDLTQAEAYADLIEAETESQRRHALALAEGGLRRQIE